MAEAARLLGRAYAVSGRVVRGRGLGRKLGFPTANVRIPRELLAPPGVFEVRVKGGGIMRPRKGVCNVGTRPTLKGKRSVPKVEVHLPRWKGNLYGRKLTVEFIRRIRPERRFSSIEALRRAISHDIESMKSA